MRLRNLLDQYTYGTLLRARLRVPLIPSHLTFEERYTLYKTARGVTGKCYVEIGSYLGASAVAIAQAIRDRDQFGTLHCVDTWHNHAMTEGQHDTFAAFIQNTLPYRDIIQTHRGWSTELALKFKEQVDFLFVDGDHSYEGVKADLEHWMPKLASGSALAMHDIGWSDGVQRAVKEIVSPIAKVERRLPNLYLARL